MNGLERLSACAGQWTGTNALQDPGEGIESTSASGVTVTPLIDGRFVRIDYTWSYKDRPQWGSMLVGFQPEQGEATMCWIDSWHNGPAMMMCSGTLDVEGTVDVRGSYPAGDGPDWGWRTEIHPDPAALRWVMYNVTPEGEEIVAVEETLARA